MLYVLHIKYIVHLTKTWSCPVTIDLRWGIAWDLKRSRSRNLTSCSRDDVQPVTKTTYWAQDDVQPVTRTTYWAQDDDSQERTDDSPAYPSPSGQPACWTRSLSYSSGEWPPLDYLWIYYWSCMRSDQTLQRSLRLGWWIIYLLLIMHAHCAVIGLSGNPYGQPVDYLFVTVFSHAQWSDSAEIPTPGPAEPQGPPAAQDDSGHLHQLPRLLPAHHTC